MFFFISLPSGFGAGFGADELVGVSTLLDVDVAVVGVVALGCEVEGLDDVSALGLVSISSFTNALV